MGVSMKGKALIFAMLSGSAIAQQPSSPLNGSLGITVQNDPVTGTTLGYLTKLTSAGFAVKASTSDTYGILGVAAKPGTAGTTGSVTIARDGIVQTVFDGTPTAGDFVEASPSVAGQAHDFGTVPSAATTQCVGRVGAPATNFGGFYNVILGGCGGGSTSSGASVSGVRFGAGPPSADTAATGSQIAAAFTGTPSVSTYLGGDGANHQATILGTDAQIPIMQGTTSYAPKSLSGDGTLSDSGVLTNTGLNGVTLASLSTGFLRLAGGVPSIATTAQTTITISGTACLLGSSCTIASGGSGTVTSFSAGTWPSWLVPTVTNSTTTPTLAVTASAIPNSALASPSITVNSQTCTLGSSCTVSGAASITTLNSSGTASVTITSATFSVVPSCTANDKTNMAVVQPVPTLSGSTVTLTLYGTANDVIAWHCIPPTQ